MRVSTGLGLVALIGASLVALIASRAAAQNVAFEDLRGMVIKSRVVRQLVNVQKGRRDIGEGDSDTTVTIDGAGLITYVWKFNWHNASGNYPSKPVTATDPLNSVAAAEALGGGHRLWTFDNGTLTFIRTYRVGAFKRTYTFTRTPTGLACEATEAQVREVGASWSEFSSAASGTITRTLSERLISSSCTVSKQ
jgi:hypothetical protein